MVPPRLTHALNKNPCCDATGRKKPASLFSGTSHRLRRVVIPLLYNGSARIRLFTFPCSPFQLGGPFGFCAFALLSPRLLGSLEIALKRTRPRQRFCYVVRQYSMTEGGWCQEEISINCYFIFLLHRFYIWKESHHH